MAQKNKAAFTARIDEELLKKFYAVAEAEGRTPNNHFLHLLRTNVAYYERIHGKIDTTKVVPPADTLPQSEPSSAGAPSLDGTKEIEG